MAYLKGAVVGLLLVYVSFWAIWSILWFPVSCVRLGFCGFDGIHYDLRGIVDFFPFTSIGVAVLIFVAGFMWEFRRARGKLLKSAPTP